MIYKLLHRGTVFSLCFSLFILVCGVLSGYALPVTEKVGKVFHLGSPVDLDGKEFKVTGEIVALSEKIKMQSGDIQVISPSIFFVIDHSGSMYYDQVTCRRDSMGYRFTVTDKIIEMLAADPTEYPGVECGLSIFGSGLYYEGDEDPLVLDTLPDSLNTNGNRSGGYLPLFKLDQDYDTKDGTMKGAAILRKYLESEIIDSSSNGYRFRIPTAPEDNNMGGSTNISLGFRAAINAVKAAANNRENRYIIFISDGESTMGWDDYEHGQILDTDSSDTNLIPTTFTIFFQQENGGHPESLDTMNYYIKNNGYSTSNAKHTQLWDFNNSTEDKLLQFVKDSIISVIIKKQVWKNLKIDGVNGLGVWNEQTQVFDLPSVIPLLGVTTPFSYTITYEIDTISRQNDIDTIKIDFEITIDHTLAQNDTIFEVSHWERTLGFYDANGNGLDSIHGAVDQFILKFINDTLTAGYKYSEVKVEVRTVNGGDVETYTLQENSFQNFLAVVLPVAVTGLGTPDNGELEYKLHDTFIATFRNSENPKLPLDTLTTSIKVNSDILEMTRGIYFDNDADGEIDSIFVEILGDCNFTDDDVTLIKNSITLPDHREFTTTGAFGLDNGVGLQVTQKSDINTAVTSDDTLVIKETIVLSDNGTINKGTVSIIDSVAAVIMKAYLVDYLDGSGDDILSITFSENIEEPKKEEPFSFYSKKDDKVYSAKLKLKNKNNDKCEFEVISVNGVSFIEQGDSIRINWKFDDNIVDKVDNNQDHPKNIRREIDVKVVTTILRSVYYDDDADGHVDRMTVTLPEYDYSDEAIEKIVDTISFPDYRLMILDKYEEKNSVITLTVYDTTNKISMTDICYTSCNINDTLAIQGEVHLSGSFYLGACSVDIIDSVAPVIMSALLVDSLKPGALDELTVIFSEAVENITRETPFKLYSINSKKEYEAKLKKRDQNNVTAVFEVLSLNEGMPRIGIGDSIRIHKDGEVFDTKKNEQDNPNNVRRQIEVKRIPIAQDVDVNSTIKLINDINMIITVTPIDNENITEYDSLAAVFDIFDVVGNTVRSGLEMEFKKEGDNIYLYFEWDCKNHFGRNVGGGTYLGMFMIDFIYKDKEDDSSIKILKHYVRLRYLCIQK